MDVEVSGLVTRDAVLSNEHYIGHVTRTFQGSGLLWAGPCAVPGLGGWHHLQLNPQWFPLKFREESQLR